MKYLWTLALAVGISALIGGIVYNAIPQTAFLDNVRLFEAFQGRKELENRLEQENNKQKTIIDSLGFRMKAVQQLAQTNEDARKRLYLMQQQYQQMSREQQGWYQQKECGNL